MRSWIATLLLAASAFAAEPPPPVAERVLSIYNPRSWQLTIYADGSAVLRFQTDSGRGYSAPAGTFDAQQVRASLQELIPDPKEKFRDDSHYIYWFETDLKKPPSLRDRYSQAETLIVPLFEKAAAASNIKEDVRGRELIKTKSFGLPPERTRRRVVFIVSPSGWMLDIYSDGYAQLQYGSNAGDGCDAPAGTFRLDDVRKVLDQVTLDPDGRISTHFAFHCEDQRATKNERPQAKYTLDAKALVPLFETAAAAGRKKGNAVWEHLRQSQPFGPK